MRNTIIAINTTVRFAVINRGVVVAGDVMGIVVRSLMLRHLRALPKRQRHRCTPKRAQAAPWRATWAAALPSYSGSSQRPSSVALACPSGSF